MIDWATEQRWLLWLTAARIPVVESHLRSAGTWWHTHDVTASAANHFDVSSTAVVGGSVFRVGSSSTSVYIAASGRTPVPSSAVAGPLQQPVSFSGTSCDTPAGSSGSVRTKAAGKHLLGRNMFAATCQLTAISDRIAALNQVNIFALLSYLPDTSSSPHVFVQHSLHWLKAPERIAFKQSVLVYKCLHGSAPAYLTDELCQVADVEAHQRLRSSSSSSLIVSRTRLLSVDDRAFPGRRCTCLEQSARSCHFRTFQIAGHYTVFRKKTPTHSFFHISMNDVSI